MTTTLRWHNYRYMPYEKRLAALEVARLTTLSPQTSRAGLAVEAKLKPEIARRFTYFDEVQGSDGRRTRTDQAVFEASATRNGATRKGTNGVTKRPVVARQATRYSAHGLHEYRGKFIPQIVRATANILGLKPGSLVLDPFCGSGTVLLEAAHLGLDAAGFDLHPLAVEIANSKVTAFHASREDVRMAAESLIEIVSPGTDLSDRRLSAWLDQNGASQLIERLPNLTYLRDWFPELVLKQLAFTLDAISRHVPAVLQSTFRVMLSDIVRDVSWQEPADLRIRRRAERAENYAALARLVDGVRRKADAICATPACQHASRIQVATLADARDFRVAGPALREHFGRRLADAVISSPPYATALPYVDMHRLSLCLLGLITDRQIRDSERVLIGNREITDRERRELDDRLRANSDELPPSCHALCVRMLGKAERPGNGFRRRNTPSLLYKYLVEMQSMFRTVARLLKCGAPLAFVVGPNRCSLGGVDFAIDTPELLREVAENSGYSLDECIELDERAHAF